MLGVKGATGVTAIGRGYVRLDSPTNSQIDADVSLFVGPAQSCAAPNKPFARYTRTFRAGQADNGFLIPQIASGQEISQSDLAAYQQTQNVYVCASVDDARRVTEQNEGNNCRCVPLPW